jgi:hypothetical protein
MHFRAQYTRQVDLMPINSCKIIIKSSDQKTATSGVAYTTDIDLYISLLNCPR